MATQKAAFPIIDISALVDPSSSPKAKCVRHMPAYIYPCYIQLFVYLLAGVPTPVAEEARGLDVDLRRPVV
jgi:hypothetical protein